MSFSFVGKTAVVTGAAGGLGRAMCAWLAAAGARVIATDVTDIGELQPVTPETFRGGAPAIRTPSPLAPMATRRLDVTDAGACFDLARETDPDIWLNNAGILGAADVDGQDPATIERLIAINLRGVVNGTQAAISTMRPKGEGRILNTGSFAAWTPAPGLAVYSATKHGVRAFTVATASELRGTGVKLSLLCPDGIWTPMLHDAVRDGSATASFTAKRLLQPDEVAAAAVALIASGKLIRSVPRSRAIQARIVGASGNAVVALKPALDKLGRAGQARLRRRLERAGDQAPAQAAAPAPAAAPPPDTGE